MFSLVDKEVITFKTVYDANANGETKSVFPGMDQPEKTFEFIKRIQDSTLNNGILPFTNTAEARVMLRKQIAHLFDALLRDRFDPISYEIKDILSEIKTLKHELVTKKGVSGEESNEPRKFLIATRYLLDDNLQPFKNCISHTAGSLDDAVPVIIKNPTFDAFIASIKYTMRIQDSYDSLADIVKTHNRRYASSFIIDHKNLLAEKTKIGTYAISSDRVIFMNKEAKKYMDDTYKKLKEILI